ncbi:hypothetical protein PHLGIDRAFT_65266 [Phlebiopsis gigantea 11061_1 CR5-6]|uniref:RNA methyltransferase n=1 Tax=Phlebiopsis gigantea (strain 11061_1 CR5-6) TaxID=745531 RepID=A0A0C3SC84_PHLG1|nr:hypothetical protein PHLGIDRAFT_65266 [Phlebiopsis gigantea 11061_1 CR5-6]
MTFRRQDAVPIYGNYHGYYSKRPLSEDRRLALLPKDLFEGARVLDVGCNEGLVTCHIAQSLGARKVVGVDIDESLITAAWKRRRSAWSQQEPSEEQISSPSRALRPDYFPASSEHMFGPLPIPTPKPRLDAFPQNLIFKHADWVTTEIAEDAEGYGVVVAFSVSKWIHLNSGDEGLLQFFHRVHTVLCPGGAFVLEPQPWDTYAKAKRMDAVRKLRSTANGLKMRPEDFPRLLREIGFGDVEHRGETGEGGEI